MDYLIYEIHFRCYELFSSKYHHEAFLRLWISWRFDRLAILFPLFEGKMTWHGLLQMESLLSGQPSQKSHQKLCNYVIQVKPCCYLRDWGLTLPYSLAKLGIKCQTTSTSKGTTIKQDRVIGIMSSVNSLHISLLGHNESTSHVLTFVCGHEHWHKYVFVIQKCFVQRRHLIMFERFINFFFNLYSHLKIFGAHLLYFYW